MRQPRYKPRRAYKQAKRGFRSAARRLREAVSKRMPAPARRALAPIARHFDMLFLDVAAVRFVFPNRHIVTPDMWRSAQPLPHHIHTMARKGIRTIVNLRGQTSTSTYAIEREACRKHGIKLIDFQIRSRATPSRAQLHAIRDLFDDLEYPVLMHCKSGADRVGLMSILYLHLKKGVAIEDALHQLSLKYGHIRQARTGVLGYFLERYLADSTVRPIEFFEWVDTVYDPDEIQAHFRSKDVANRFVDSVLSRE